MWNRSMCKNHDWGEQDHALPDGGNHLRTVLIVLLRAEIEQRAGSLQMQPDERWHEISQCVNGVNLWRDMASTAWRPRDQQAKVSIQLP